MKRYYKKLGIVFALSIFTLTKATLKDRVIETGAGLAIGVTANFALNYLETLGHELGHALTNKVLTGNPVKISITRSYHGGSFNILAPWKGTAYMGTANIDSFKDTLRFIAGPLSGITTAHLMLHLFDRLENYYIRPPKDQRSYDSWKQPLPFLKDLYTSGEILAQEKFLSNKDFQSPPLNAAITPKANTRALRIAATALRLLKSMRCVRIITECIYGFTPVTIPEGIGDGQILWRNLLNRAQNAPPSWNCFSLLTNIVLCGPLALGFIKTLLTHKDEPMHERKN